MVSPGRSELFGSEKASRFRRMRRITAETLRAAVSAWRNYTQSVCPTAELIRSTLNPPPSTHYNGGTFVQMTTTPRVTEPAMTDYRIEKDSMGEVQVPAQAYYGAQTQRAVENFPISGWPLHPDLIHAIGLVKLACATANRDLGKLIGTGKNPLDESQVAALMSACREVADGRHDEQFPIDVFQTGSGTSSNMNANEVISNRAIEITGGDRFAAAKPIHPNDHVNMGQSTNDTFPDCDPCRCCSQIDPREPPPGNPSTSQTVLEQPRPRNGTR